MKIRSLISALAVLAAFTYSIACKKETQKVNSGSFTQQLIASGPDWPPPAPPGQHWELHYKYNGFNFHRPKYGCEKGFWFCFLEGDWEWELHPDNAYSSAFVDGTSSNLVGFPLSNNKLALHFPIEIKTLCNYNQGDLDFLNVDDEMIVSSEGKVIALGNYPVTETENELIVTVDIK